MNKLATLLYLRETIDSLILQERGIKETSFMRTNIEDLKINRRLKNKLKSNDIQTVKDIYVVFGGPKRLKSLRNIGEKSVSEIISCLKNVEF